jgi:hypothetical protein
VANPLTVTVGPPISGNERTAIDAANIATFTDGNPSATAGDFTAIINWGDNTTSPGTVVANTGGPGFVVNGPAHTYLDEGTFPVTVTISDKGGNTATATTPATMADTDVLTAAGPATATFNPQNPLQTVVTAIFHDSDTSVPANDLIATINWGDNTPPTLGTLTDTAGTVSVVGSHTYTATGTFTTTVTLAEADGPANSASAHTTFVLVGAAPMVVADRTGVQVGAAVSGNVLANDTDPIAGDTGWHVSAVNGQPVDHTVVVAGKYGSLALNADNGSYTYSAPSSDVLPTSGVAEDVFTYTASTGLGGTADSTLTVIVTAAGLNYLGGQPGIIITPPGGGHSPVLDGGAGNDTLIAKNGATVLIGGPGDTLTGNKGADTYVFTGHFGQNIITNYNANKDIIELDHSNSQFTDLTAVQHASKQVGTNVVISDNLGDGITLLGVSLSQLHFDASHFLLT